jgi:ribosome-associated protein
MPLNSLGFLHALLEASLDKKAEEPSVYCISPVVDYANYLLVLTIHNPNHSSAVIEALSQRAKRLFQTTPTIEGQGTGWAILDFGDVIVHLFDRETREYYDFDGLWVDMRSNFADPSAQKKRGVVG